MKINIYNSARSFTVYYWNDDAEWEDACPYSTIDAAVEAAHIIDTETGEIYVTCTWDENDIPEEDYGPWDDVDESNYDPYAGCDMYEVEPFDFY